MDINAQAWGSPEEGKVVVYISRRAHDAIYQHGASYPQREVGGILVGDYRQDESGKYRVWISGVVEARAAPGDRTEMVFDGQAWQQIVSDTRARYPGQKVVGWYHTHPGFGVFLSSDDVGSHTLAFSQPWQIAAVYDPVNGRLGFFGWEGSEIKAIKGFYTFEEPAEKPKVSLPTGRVPVRQPRATSAVRPVVVVSLIAGLAAVALGVLLVFGWLSGGMTPPLASRPSQLDQTACFRCDNVTYEYLFLRGEDGIEVKLKTWMASRERTRSLGRLPLDKLTKEGTVVAGTSVVLGQPITTPKCSSGNCIGRLEIPVTVTGSAPLTRILASDIRADGTLSEWQVASYAGLSPFDKSVSFGAGDTVFRYCFRKQDGKVKVQMMVCRYSAGSQSVICDPVRHMNDLEPPFGQVLGDAGQPKITSYSAGNQNIGRLEVPVIIGEGNKRTIRVFAAEISATGDLSGWKEVLPEMTNQQAPTGPLRFDRSVSFRDGDKAYEYYLRKEGGSVKVQLVVWKWGEGAQKATFEGTRELKDIRLEGGQVVESMEQPTISGCQSGFGDCARMLEIKLTTSKHGIQATRVFVAGINSDGTLKEWEQKE